MYVPFARLHRDSAVALFRQRQGWLAQDATAAVPLGRLERRLRLHLHVLSRCGDEDPPPEKGPETFVHLAARLDSPLEGQRIAGVEAACAFLAEGGAQGEGAFAALALVAPPEAQEALLDLYRGHEGLRPTLFRLWREQGVVVPAALVARDELRRGGVDLQQAALEYAAEAPAVGPEIFRSFYQPLLGGAAAPKIPKTLLVPALWGGMVRGEREASRALRRAIERETGAGDEALLRLAALGGDADFLPVLRRHFETDPAQGAGLLALHGRAGAVEILLEALKHPPARTAVARVWPHLTGSPLPLVPRLRLVGDENPGENAATIPDPLAAIRWWEEHRKEGAGRWIGGAAMSTAHLADLAGKTSGTAGRDILDLLALQLGRPLGLSANAEQARRRVALQEALNQAPLRAVKQQPPGVSCHV
ncbi:hypothetical protein DSOUD_3243 [Desulfuromonas soudanensis]|uniref:TIGR02270 family protein n=1 Tax=Desulfuromonas soudanensis TaxID=1603606 RepID=A0A0M3QGK5_9BACT|nr:hypothetical protein [Desulfuromonas soudanensis]ALC17963.1 hypothetical protein DSOUD_3243 [Desulfuromonas soudanensis]